MCKSEAELGDVASVRCPKLAFARYLLWILADWVNMDYGESRGADADLTPYWRALGST